MEINFRSIAQAHYRAGDEWHNFLLHRSSLQPFRNPETCTELQRRIVSERSSWEQQDLTQNFRNVRNLGLTELLFADRDHNFSLTDREINAVPTLFHHLCPHHSLSPASNRFWDNVERTSDSLNPPNLLVTSPPTSSPFKLVGIALLLTSLQMLGLGMGALVTRSLNIKSSLNIMFAGELGFALATSALYYFSK